MKANSKANAKAVANTIAKPTALDIMMGRGGMSNNHPGNKHYHTVLETRAWEYSQLKGRNAKTDLAWEVFHQLKREGARFLKYDKPTGEYIEASNDDARKKISQRLRELALEVREHTSSEEEEAEALDTPIPLKADNLRVHENPFEADTTMSDLLKSCFLDDDDTNKKPSPTLDTLLNSSLHSYDFHNDPSPFSSWEEINSDYAVCSSLGDLSACELSTLATAPLPLTFDFSFDWPNDFLAEQVPSNEQPLRYDQDLRFGRVASFPGSFHDQGDYGRVAKRRRESH
ncbi:expressed unknown protein [Seminavis robusta]|uniref:DUF6824 domain-containing protein n=1 Tax=Seminavis robusta TaxID=568900 RepID=A0A9N8HZL5_9STRA|nr:expressed unknown protein [Seminavis robusta]|eukprot:Sro2319_g323120.1 n/a (286) ;mRNA; f:3880-4737